ncbi:lipoprotein lipase-like [Leguminivora glycinivorella]|uniref:lipoprotein lipase-like n=1 Tax=Leguminivora glycinivorella TaxID=1035111 RepID=UPI00200DC351|nr:lipoprotein lipase-like [Leguminivora glycinivorella]
MCHLLFCTPVKLQHVASKLDSCCRVSFFIMLECITGRNSSGFQNPTAYKSHILPNVMALWTSGVDMEQIISSPGVAIPLGLTGNEDVAIIVHGRESSVYSDFVNTLRFSLANADKTMVIVMVDWSYLSYSSYEQAVSVVPSIATELRSFIGLIANLNPSRLHLIGFDLGAHIVGIANRNAATTARAAKITALSPAGQRWGSGTLRLRANDATTVEVIHTDTTGARAFGTPDALGTIDIYPNGGTRQSGCAASDNACNHNRAWELFAATVDTGGHLMALRCDSITEVNNNRCTGTPPVIMGTLALLKMQRGLYRVNTGNTYPFSA